MRTSAWKSRIVEPRGQLDGLDERAPALALLVQDASPRRGQPVVAAAPLIGFLHPAAGDEAASLETVEHGVERRRLKRDPAGAPGRDLLADLVPMPGALLELREHEQFRSALLQRRIRVRCLHIFHSYIYHPSNGRRERIARYLRSGR